MTNQWGGPRPNAGRKPGQKNKMPAQGRVKNIIKQATFTPDEWATIAGDMGAAEVKNFAAYCRMIILERIKK